MKDAKWIVLLLLACAIWGTTFALVKDTLQFFPTFALLAFRFGLAAVLFAIYIRASGRKVSGSEWKYGTLLGFFLFAYYATQTWGLNFTTATNSAFITGIYVLLVPLLASLVLAKMPQRKIWLAVLMAFVGLYFLSGATGQFNIGDAVTLLTAIFVAFQIVYTAKYVHSCDIINLVFVQILVAAILNFALMLAAGQTPSAYPLPAIGATVFLAIFGVLFAQIVQIGAQKRIEPERIALIFLSEPIFAAIFGFLYLGEMLSPLKAFGAGLMLLAMFISIEQRLDV